MQMFEVIDKLEQENKELKYRLEQCIKLLKAAKCPQPCSGNCTWCYEREVEVRPHDNEK